MLLVPLVASVQDFSDCHVDKIVEFEKDDRLKCYMFCFVHEIEHYDTEHEFDEIDLHTEDEIKVWMEVFKSCEHLQSFDSPVSDMCDHAFQLESCWKRSNPEVKVLSFKNIFL